MSPLYAALVIPVFVAGILSGLAARHRYVRHSRAQAAQRQVLLTLPIRPPTPTTSTGAGPQPAPRQDRVAVFSNPTRVLAPPPLIRTVRYGALTVREWATHFAPGGEDVWTLIVDRFHQLCAGDPVIADYFPHASDQDLRRHFVRALLQLVDDGVTVGSLQRIVAQHHDVRGRAGEPIDREVVERFAAALSTALREAGLAQDSIDQVLAVLGPVGAALCRPQLDPGQFRRGRP